MRKIMILLMVAALAGIGIGVQRYLSAGTQYRNIKGEARNFHSLLQGAAKTGGSDAVVHEIVAQMAVDVDGVDIDPDQVEVVAIPIEVGEGKHECDVAAFPEEFEKLTTLEKGNIKNITMRCGRDVSIVGFRAIARDSAGTTFPIEGWGYARDFN